MNLKYNPSALIKDLRLERDRVDDEQRYVNTYGSGGDHSLLTNLGYASSGHTGFLQDANDVIKDTNINWGSGANQVDVSDLPIQILGSPTYNTQKDFNKLFGSTGRATGGEVTDGGSETVNVAAGTGFIKATDSDTADLLSFNWSATTGIAVATNTVVYIGVRYNSGSPEVFSTSDEYGFDLDTSFPLSKVTNEAGTLHILNNPWWVTDGTTNIIERLQALGHIVRDMHFGGLILGVSGTRNISVTAGKLWSRLNEFEVTALDTSSSGTFEYYWYNGVAGTWNSSDVSQYSVLQYNDITQATLQNLSNNWYANIWVYAEADDDTIALLYPQAQYSTSANAEAESPPTTIPLHISENAILIGRILIKQNTNTPVEVQSAFDTLFNPAQAADHGNLSGLSDDDHTQYLLVNGTRALGGNWSLGGYHLTNGGSITGATLSDGNISTTAGVVTGLVSLTDGTASWASSSLSNFSSITGATLSDGNISTTAGVVTGLVSLTDGTASWASSALSGFDKISISQTSTTGNSLYITRNLASASTNAPLCYVLNQNASDDQNTVYIKNYGTGYGLQIEQHGAASSIYLNPDSDAAALNIVNTGNSSLAIYVFSNRASGTQPLVYFQAGNATYNQNALKVRNAGTSQGVYIDQDGANSALYIDNSGIGDDISILKDAAKITHLGATSLTIASTSGVVIVDGITHNAGAISGVTTLSMDNQLTNTLAIGTAPFVITSTTQVANLNVARSGVADTVTCADESADTSCYVTFVTDATGNLAIKTGTNLTFNSDTGILTATGFAGELTGDVIADKVTSPELEFAGDITIDAVNAIGASTVYILNSDGVQVANLDVEGDAMVNGGALTLGGAAQVGSIVLYDGSDNTVTLTVPALAGNYVLTLPTTDGDANQLLKTDGSGNLGWGDPSALGNPFTLSPDCTMADVNADGEIGYTGSQLLMLDGAQMVDLLPERDRRFIKSANLIHYWKFDEKDVGTAHDYGSGAYDLTDAGTPTTGDGIVGSATVLNGSDEYWTTSTTTDFDDDTTGTISVWVKLDTFDSSKFYDVFCISDNAAAAITEFSIKIDDTSDKYYSILTQDGTQLFSMYSNSRVPSIDVNKWVNITITQDGIAPKMFIDGMLQNATISVGTNVTSWFKAILTDATTDADTVNIGARQRNGTPANFVDGSIDEVMYWNAALTDEEVLELYNSYANQNISSFSVAQSNTSANLSYYRDSIDSANAVNLWSFNEHSTATATDDIGSDDLTGVSIATFGAGIIGSAPDLDGTADFYSTATLTTWANLTTGSVSAWVYGDDDSGSSEFIWCFSRDADATVTYIDVRYDYANDRIRSVCFVDGVVQWDFTTVNDSLDPYIGAWANIVLTHDGTTPALYINGVAQTITFGVTTDKTKWLKAIITDATSPVDTFNIGAYQHNSVDSLFFDGKIDEVRIYSDALTASEVGRLYRSYMPTTLRFNSNYGTAGYLEIDVYGNNLRGIRLNTYGNANGIYIQDYGSLTYPGFRMYKDSGPARTGTGTSAWMSIFMAHATNTGDLVNISNAGTAGVCLDVIQDNASCTSNAVNIRNDGTRYGLYVNQDGEYMALGIDTTNSSYAALYVYSNYGASTTQPLAYFAADNVAWTGQPVVSILLDGYVGASSGALYINDTNAINDNAIYHSSGAKLTHAGVWTDAPSYSYYKNPVGKLEGVVDKIKTLRSDVWKFKEEIKGTADQDDHCGVYLDEFYNTFGVGNLSGVNTQDEIGVLYQAVKELSDEIELLKKH